MGLQFLHWMREDTAAPCVWSAEKTEKVQSALQSWHTALQVFAVNIQYEEEERTLVIRYTPQEGAWSVQALHVLQRAWFSLRQAGFSVHSQWQSSVVSFCVAQEKRLCPICNYQETDRWEDIVYARNFHTSYPLSSMGDRPFERYFRPLLFTTEKTLDLDWRVVLGENYLQLYIAWEDAGAPLSENALFQVRNAGAKRVAQLEVRAEQEGWTCETRWAWKQGDRWMRIAMLVFPHYEGSFLATMEQEPSWLENL